MPSLAEVAAERTKITIRSAEWWSSKMNGRDHNSAGFSVWLAGGGIQGGTIVGATDEYGYAAVESRKSVNDLHATILHQLGLNHEKLTFLHNGRNMRIMDVSGDVIREVVTSA